MNGPAIERSFGRAADRYLRHARVQAEFAAWAAEWVDDRSGRAVEFGAGPGVFTRLASPWRGEYLATDLSPAMVAAGAAAIPSARWERAAAERPPAGPWDRIFSSSMLQWLDNPAQVLAGWRRVAAPGARLLAGVFVRPTLAEWEMVAGAPPLAWRTEDEWTALAAEAGWDVLRSQTTSRQFEFPSARALLRSVHATGAAPYRRLSPAALRRALRQYEQRCGGESGVTSTWTFCRFEASNG